MKKISLRAILASLFIMASLGSYIFLSVVSTEEYASQEKVVQSEESPHEQNEIILPDVALVKKVVELTRKISEVAQ